MEQQDVGPPLDDLRDESSGQEMIESLPEELLDSTYSPLSSIRGLDDGPLVASVDDGELRRRTLQLARGMLLVGVAIVCVLLVQTVHMLRTPTAPTAPLQLAPEVKDPLWPVRDVDQILAAARLELDRGLFTDVVDQLQRLEATASLMSQEQRFRLFSTLSLAYRRLNDLERAAEYGSRAMDQFLESETAAGIVARAEDLRAAGDLSGARREYARILLRVDGLAAQDHQLGAIARIHLADCYLIEARARTDIQTLPSLPLDLTESAGGRRP